VLDDDSFRAVVASAKSRGLPVVAHAEGSGQAQRAARLGADRLAHAPFTKRLTEDEIAEQAASVEWISTLAIHDDTHRAIAIDNVRRFADAGGTVLYGTDMGNGPTPVDLNRRELDALREAGIDSTRLLRALAPRDDDPHPLFLPDGDPAAAHPLTHPEA
jgi:imidazolonepropionase-like amidohydrolase